VSLSLRSKVKLLRGDGTIHSHFVAYSTLVFSLQNHPTFQERTRYLEYCTSEAAQKLVVELCFAVALMEGMGGRSRRGLRQSAAVLLPLVLVEHMLPCVDFGGGDFGFVVG
jgi:hypothetical protein